MEVNFIYCGPVILVNKNALKETTNGSYEINVCANAECDYYLKHRQKTSKNKGKDFPVLYCTLCGEKLQLQTKAKTSPMDFPREVASEFGNTYKVRQNNNTFYVLLPKYVQDIDGGFTKKISLIEKEPEFNPLLSWLPSQIKMVDAWLPVITKGKDILIGGYAELSNVLIIETEDDWSS